MVLHRNGEMLYNGVCTLVAENLAELARDEVYPAFPTSGSEDRMQQSQEDEMLLKALRRVWDDHTGSMSKLRDILKYMVSVHGLFRNRHLICDQDRAYSKSAELPEIWDAGYILFWKHIIQPPIDEHIYSAILGQIRMERDGYPINRSAVKECVDVLLVLRVNGDGPSVYGRDLEPAILCDSELFYKREADSLLESCGAPEYLRRVSILKRTLVSNDLH
jgi:cullin 3